MGSWEHFLGGLSIVLQPENLFFCFIGVLAGTLVGVLPGIGPVGAVALLLPTTFRLNPVSAVIMLAGINYGAQYGGSTTSILVNVPGESSSVITCLDGYQMARKGRAGPALGIAAFGSFIAGTLSVAGVMLLAPVLSRAALAFGPPEYFTLMFMSIMIVAYLVRGSMVKALIMFGLGLIMGTLGMDPITGKERFSYEVLALRDGFGVIPVVIGMFGVAEIMESISSSIKAKAFQERIKGYLPSRQDWRDSAAPIARGSLLGFILGIFPGITPLLPTFLIYGIEKKLSRHPERFGAGVIEGVAAPESSNNAASTAGFVPLLSLGIPSNAFNAVLLGALMVYGLRPGPLLIKSHPDLFWGLLSSMYVGNVLLLVLNLPLIPLWVWVLRVPYTLLSVLILIFCFLGAYSINNSLAEVTITFAFGIFGFLIRKFNFEAPPFILAFVLGPLMETAFRQSLIMSGGSFSIFVTQPISTFFLLVAFGVLITAFIKKKPFAKGIESES